MAPEAPRRAGLRSAPGQLSKIGGLIISCGRRVCDSSIASDGSFVVVEMRGHGTVRRQP